jgi:hypothetical protein
MNIWNFHTSFDFHLLRYSTKGAYHINKQGIGILPMLFKLCYKEEATH